MATCEEWNEWFLNAAYWFRGIGSEPPPSPDGLIPEGCNLSPCDPATTEMAAMIQALRDSITTRDFVNVSRSANGCPLAQVFARRSASGGSFNTSFQVSAVAGGACGVYSSSIGFSNPLSCQLPPPDPVPGPYSGPLDITVVGGPWDGTQFTSETFYVPTFQFYDAIAQQSDCVCQLLDQIQQRLNSINISQKAVGVVRADQQENFISLLKIIADSGNNLAGAIKALGVSVGGVQLESPPGSTVVVLSPNELTPVP